MGPLAYAALVSFLRRSGKRTLAQLNAFDFVVTVGLTIATVVLSADLAFAEARSGWASSSPSSTSSPPPAGGCRSCGRW